MTDTTTPDAVEPAADGSAAAATPAPDDSKGRDYGIYHQENIDTSDPEAALEALRKHLVPGGSQSVTVMVKVGRAHAKNPTSAMDEIIQMRDLDGDYDVIAESAKKHFPGVKTQTQRSWSSR